MPYFEKDILRLYYEDVGKGEPIIANHGLLEDGTYWSETGVTAKLAENYRVISIDMRGHARTIVDGPPYGFDVETMAHDFDDLADYLGIDKFHLLTHATGGMVGAWYGMTRSERLISLMLTDTSSYTRIVEPDYREFTEEEKVQRAMGREMWEKASEEQREQMKEARIAAEEKISTEEWMAGVRNEPGVFLFKMAEHPDSDAMFKIYEGFIRRQVPRQNVNFRMNFYTDPDPHIDMLRKVKCPTLVLIGEFDLAFLEPSEIMASEIPDVRHVVMKGIGHMTAIEDPEGTITELLDFLETVKETGKANR
ncbi:MAG: alpha/beta fold hydrolase [Promethearchaeota archaeon]|jgi:pimeloyl-ACP methyl ester carboxylesterase